MQLHMIYTLSEGNKQPLISYLILRVFKWPLCPSSYSLTDADSVTAESWERLLCSQTSFLFHYFGTRVLFKEVIWDARKHGLSRHTASLSCCWLIIVRPFRSLYRCQCYLRGGGGIPAGAPIGRYHNFNGCVQTIHLKMHREYRRLLSPLLKHYPLLTSGNAPNSCRPCRRGQNTSSYIKTGNPGVPPISSRTFSTCCITTGISYLRWKTTIILMAHPLDGITNPFQPVAMDHICTVMGMQWEAQTRAERGAPDHITYRLHVQHLEMHLMWFPSSSNTFN